MMLSIDQIRRRLRDANLSRVADNAGIKYGPVYRFMRGETSPSYATVKALSDYLEGIEADHEKEAA